MKTCKKGLHQYEIGKGCPKCRQASDAAWHEANKDKHKAQTAKWNKANPDKRKGYYLRKYWPGSTAEEALAYYLIMVEEQEGKCAVCQTHQNDLRQAFDVDHNHNTGKVRGLLCNKCNQAEGQLDKHLKNRALMAYRELYE